MSTGWWYKRFPSDFLRSTMMLSCEEKGAYGVLLDMMYEKNGPIPDDPQWIARMCGCSVRRWTTILRPKLIEMGKINVKEDGSLSNGRVIYETHQAGERIKAAKERHDAAKPTKIVPDAPAEKPRKIPEKTQIIKLKPNENMDLFHSDLGLKERKKESKEESSLRSGRSLAPPAAGLLAVDRIAEARSVWNEVCVKAGLPACREMPDARRKTLQRALTTRFTDPGAWPAFCRTVAASAFLTSGGFGIDWVLKPANTVKIMEGNYDGDRRGQLRQSGVTQMQRKWNLPPMEVKFDPEPEPDKRSLVR